MIQEAVSSETAPAGTETLSAAESLPEGLWPAAVNHLVRGQDYLLLLDGELRILRANEAFAREVGTTWKEWVGRSFLETLTDGAAEEMRRVLALGPEAPASVELMHPLRCGIRTVQYHFHVHGTLCLAVGRDQSVQLELVSQMASLVNDLTVQVGQEQERSQSLKKLAEVDPLTGLANRRGLERVYESHCGVYRKRGRVFSVISIDVDRFKQVNDTYGHPAGDEILRRVARVLEESLRDGDCVARIGGEEFMVIAVGAGPDEGMMLGERLRRAVELATMPEPLRSVTISVGVTSAPKKTPGEAETEQRDLIALADNALYAAKNSGRNCVRFVG